MLDKLREVIDPEIGVNIVDLGLVYECEVDENRASVAMTMTTAACPMGPFLVDAVEGVLLRQPGIESAEVRVVWDPPWTPSMMSDAARAQLGWNS